MNITEVGDTFRDFFFFYISLCAFRPQPGAYQINGHLSSELKLTPKHKSVILSLCNVVFVCAVHVISLTDQAQPFSVIC